MLNDDFKKGTNGEEHNNSDRWQQTYKESKDELGCLDEEEIEEKSWSEKTQYCNEARSWCCSPITSRQIWEREMSISIEFFKFTEVTATTELKEMLVLKKLLLNQDVHIKKWRLLIWQSV